MAKALELHNENLKLAEDVIYNDERDFNNNNKIIEDFLLSGTLSYNYEEINDENALYHIHPLKKESIEQKDISTAEVEKNVDVLVTNKVVDFGDERARYDLTKIEEELKNEKKNGIIGISETISEEGSYKKFLKDKISKNNFYQASIFSFLTGVILTLIYVVVM